MPSSSSKKLAIVPAFKESGNIGRTVKEIKDSGLFDAVLVVDDGSEDATGPEAQAAGATVISLPFNLGIGGAVQTGFQYAHRYGFDLAVQIDGDGQHDVSFCPQLLSPVDQGQADLVIGSRFLPPFLGYRSSLIRRVGIHFFSWLISGLTGCPVTDPTSGFRVYSRKAIKLFVQDYPGDFPEPESVVLAARAGLTVLELPVEMRKRVAGHSSIRYLMTFYYMVKVTFAILLDMMKRRNPGAKQ